MFLSSNDQPRTLLACGNRQIPLPRVTQFTLVYIHLLGTIQSEIGEIPLQSVENVARKEPEERIITEDFPGVEHVIFT